MKSLALLAALSLATGALAQLPDAPAVSVKFDAKTAKAGSIVKGKVTVTFAKGLHGYQNPPTDEYQIPIKIEVVENGFKLIKAAYPKGVERTLAGTKGNVYEGTIQIPITVKAASKPALYHVNVRLSYQQCNEATCFPPSAVVAKGDLKVVKK